MRSLRVPLSFLLVLLWLHPAHPQAPRRDPQAAALLLGALSAARVTAQGNIRTLTLRAEASCSFFVGLQEAVFPCRLILLGPRRIRWEVQKPEGLAIYVIHGRGGWRDIGNGRRDLALGETAGFGIENLPIILVSELLTRPEASFANKGRVTTDGAAFHQVEVVPMDAISGSSAATDEQLLEIYRKQLFLDPATLLPKRLSYSEGLGDWRRRVPAELAFSDYRQAGPFVMPHVITRFVSNKKISEIRFTQFMWNVQVSEAEFLRR